MREDPEELTDLAGDPAHAADLTAMEAEMRKLINPEKIDAQAFADQAAMIARYGGREKALKLGAPAATPPPKV